MGAIALDENHILLFLFQFFLILCAARVLGELFRMMRQPMLTGELLAGILLGPTVLARLSPQIHGMLFPVEPVQVAMIETVSWIGVLFLLLECGLEFDFSVAWRQKGDALTIALSDIVIPMVIAFVPSLFLPRMYLTGNESRWLFALFMASVMTISAMPVAAKALHDLRVLKSEMGFLIMSALAVNDVVGWVIFTVVLALFSSDAINLVSLAATVLFTISFAFLALRAGPRLSTRVVSLLRAHGMPEPASSLTLICLVGLLFGLITQAAGIHALFGFFIAGVVIGEAKSLSEESRRIISQVVYAVFVPVFFAGIGLKVDFLKSFDWRLALFVSVIGIAGRYLGAWVGVSFSRSFKADRVAISIAHTPGGVMEIVISLLAFNAGLITESVFVAIVFAALLSSMLMGPWMARAIRRHPPISMRYVHPELIIVTAAEPGRDTIITQLSERIALMGAVSSGPLTAAVVRREQEYSTSLGEGLAIPHARIEGIDQPYIAYAHSPLGVDWNSPDGEPARHIFLIAMPRAMEAEQVRVLAAIARMMSKAANRSYLDQATDPGAIAEKLNRDLSSELLGIQKRPRAA
jgi:Kef-type K+ transport system membrane component KefB/mannitol/fructose-specific phosphotransferase system IIA component (Ntr-type)